MFSMTSAMQEFSATWSNPSFTSRSSPMLPPNLRGLQHAVAAHKVDIYVSLEYLREEVSSSFESRQPEDPVVSHFCKAVNYQASGAQVQTHATALAATVETRVIAENRVYDYECRILRSNRTNDLNGSHYFNGERVVILDLTVEQTVYVSGSLSSDQITSIVMSRFNKGDGGRIRFRALLRENDAFDSLVNVEVLGGLSSPFVDSAAPTDGVSTAFPSLGPMSVQSDFPSSMPSSVRSAKSNFPSQPPTPFVQPMEVNNFLPSSVPAIVSAPAKASSSEDSQPLIMGIIAGGLVTIGVSCFFMFCVWFPFQRKRRRQNGDVQPGNGSSELNPVIRDAAIPETLHLDDESRSLANTTVTLGEISSKKISKPCVSAWTSESFDDTSIYTSTLPLASPDSERFYCSPDRKNQRIETVEEAIEIGFVDDDGQSSSRSPTRSSWNDMIEDDMFRDETRGTKGFDVFSDDDASSYDFGSSIALSDPSFGLSGKKEMDCRPAPSPSSAKTRRTMNLDSHKSARSLKADEEKTRDNDHEVVDDHQITLESQMSTSKLDNNALLRTVLDNARRSERKGSSKISLKSAPPRIHDLRPWNNDVNRLHQYRSTGLGDHLRIQGFQKQFRPQTARSVGTYGEPVESSLYESSVLQGSVAAQRSGVSSATRQTASPFTETLVQAAMVSPASSADPLHGEASGVLGITSISSSASFCSADPEHVSVECIMPVHSGSNSAFPTRSDGSFSTYASRSLSLASSKETIESTTKTSALEHDLERIGLTPSPSHQSEESLSSALASRSSNPTRLKEHHVIVVVPPGKIGVVLTNRHDGRGTIVSEVRSSSTVRGMLFTGDTLVAVDGIDVTQMDVREITSMMADSADNERRLTLVSTRVIGSHNGRDEFKDT